MKPLVLKGIKKHPWPVTLPDGTKITLQPPKMSLVARLGNSEEAADPIVQMELLANLLSCNFERKKFTKEQVGNMFDYADMELFMTNYFEYLNEFSSAKN